jgi:hypothetical protein
MRQVMQRCAAIAAILLTFAVPASATSGPGCLVVVNVAYNDALNVRERPSASSRIVDVLPPGSHGIIHLDGRCEPLSRPWASRWCPITHYSGDRTTSGYVKARFVRDSDCP